MHTVLELVFASGSVSAEDFVEWAALNGPWSHFVLSDFVWALQCDQLWADKVFVPVRFKTDVDVYRIEAYWKSLKDSRRVVITLQELCEIQWSLRSKPGSGRQLSDPWWQDDPTDGSPRRPTWITRFHPDGTISGHHPVPFLGGPLSQIWLDSIAWRKHSGL